MLAAVNFSPFQKNWRLMVPGLKTTKMENCNSSDLKNIFPQLIYINIMHSYDTVSGEDQLKAVSTNDDWYFKVKYFNKPYHFMLYYKF